MGKVCLAVGFSGILRLLGYATDPLLDSRDIHRLVGEPARIPSAPRPDSALKIVTWNVERGEAFDEILTALRALDADILMLQEVDRDCRRTEFRDVARELAHALSMNWVGAGEFQEIGEARQDRPAVTGQATLSKFTIDAADVLRFRAQDRWRWSFNPVQPRRGGRIALQAETAGVVFYNTHIESGRNEGLQRQQIAEILESQARHATGRPVVIGGDFNNGPILRSSMFGYFSSAEFEDALGEMSQRGPTSFGQRDPIDWLFVKNVTPLRGRIVEVMNASDHFPVIAALDLAPALASR